jgi:toxin ParE1/3/4
MAEIIKLSRAADDLAEIWDYIADDSEAQADLFIDTIDRKLRLLAEQPNLGRSRGELAENMRSFPIGRYVISISSCRPVFRLSVFCMVPVI